MPGGHPLPRLKRTSLTEMMTTAATKSDAARGIRRSGQIAVWRSRSTTGAAVRPPDLAVVRQDGIDHDLLSVMFLIVTRMSFSSSPV